MFRGPSTTVAIPEALVARDWHPLHPHPATQTRSLPMPPWPSPTSKTYVFRGYSAQFWHKENWCSLQESPWNVPPRSTLVRRLAGHWSTVWKSTRGPYSQARQHIQQWQSNEGRPHNQVGWCRGDEPQSMGPAKMYSGSLAHPVIAAQNDRDEGPLPALYNPIIHLRITPTHTPLMVCSYPPPLIAVNCIPKFYNPQLYFVRGILLSFHTFITT